VQSTCPNCQNRIVIDDAKVPDRPFSVKCPKCQTVVRFPGRAAAAPAGAGPATVPSAPPEPEPPPSEEARAQMMAQLRRDMTHGDASRQSVRALVSVHDRALAGAIALPLSRLGLQVDSLENADDGARLLEQGVFDVVVTTRAVTTTGKESLFQRIGRLSPDARRRIFVVLVGDDLKTGDGTQAWATMSDLVLNPRDAASADVPLANTISERSRLFQAYVDARRRHEQAGS
jgi:predicted Zn finger-like uncharacterized protein